MTHQELLKIAFDLGLISSTTIDLNDPDIEASESPFAIALLKYALYNGEAFEEMLPRLMWAAQDSQRLLHAVLCHQLKPNHSSEILEQLEGGIVLSSPERQCVHYGLGSLKNYPMEFSFGGEVINLDGLQKQFDR